MRERREGGLPQVPIEDSAAGGADHVERAGDRKGRDRQAGGQRLEQHDAEGVGEAREDEHVGGGIDPRQILARQGAEEAGLRISSLELAAGRAVADDDLRAGQIEAQEGLEVLLHGDAADIEEDGRRRIQDPLARAAGTGSVSTPRVQRMMFLKPRPVSSRSREGVLTIMARAARWNRLRAL